MARIWFLTQFIPACFAASFPAAESNLIKAAGVSHSQRAAGVFMLIEGEKYTFNFTSARAACLSLNVTIATTEQMMRALQQGLETCKYGWIAEQIAAIPRITPNKNCGQGQTELVLWPGSADRKFAVFCFNASDIEETSSTSKAAPQTTSSSPTTPTALTQTPTPTTTELTSTKEEPKTTKPPKDTSSTLLLNPLVETTRSTGIFSTSTSLETSSTRFPTSPSHPTTVTTFISSTSVPVLLHNGSSARPSLEAVSTALIILGVILLLLAAAGVVWYYKLNIFTIWSMGQQKDDTETEMWKHTDSEMDLHSQHGAEEDDAYEESDRKYSSDITLCVNPDIKAMYTE
ncbi:lymphatic vessel endothelial hyaluronic receptor 1b [Solea solea]|uniref:lymphatic vessel endothelial hyaluronic receptor 1b n=1 Tax=Solea solea TaxID=90069 RepID=UPI00272D2FB3|nr:lymphatic vessel endothelial hyaluronic receptor 1b [Solea solea]